MEGRNGRSPDSRRIHPMRGRTRQAMTPSNVSRLRRRRSVRRQSLSGLRRRRADRLGRREHPLRWDRSSGRIVCRRRGAGGWAPESALQTRGSAASLVAGGNRYSDSGHGIGSRRAGLLGWIYAVGPWLGSQSPKRLPVVGACLQAISPQQSRASSLLQLHQSGEGNQPSDCIA